jgi:hypothetical protein
MISHGEPNAIGFPMLPTTEIAARKGLGAYVQIFLHVDIFRA